MKIEGRRKRKEGSGRQEAGFFWRFRKAFSGMTLVEMMVVVAIFTMLFAAMMTVFASGRTSFQTQDTQIELQQEVRKAADRMVQELRQTGSVAISTTLATNDTATFQLPTGFDNSTGLVTWGGNVTYLRGGLNNSQLIRTFSGSNTTLANDVVSLTFAKPSTNVVTVNVTMNKTCLTQVDLTAGMTARVRLRN